MDDKTLDDLIKKFKTEDKKRNFEKIYEHFLPEIFRFITLQVSTRHAVEDLTSEVFIKVYRFLDKARVNSATIRPWIYRIARNTLIDYYRKTAKNKANVSIDDYLGYDNQSNILDIPGFQYSSEDISDNSDFSNIKLMEAMKLLSELQRQVLLLRFVEDMDYRTIGRILNRAENSIRAIKFRALMKLREFLK